MAVGIMVRGLYLVSILARPGRTGAPISNAVDQAGRLFQSSPVQVGRAL